MKALLISVTVLLFTISAAAQNTTWEEYKYMKDGIADYFFRGVDLKNGYYLGDEFTYSEDSKGYQYKFVGFKRKSDNSIAGIILKVKNNKTNVLKFFPFACYGNNVLNDSDYKEMVSQTDILISNAPYEIKKSIYWYIINYFGRLKK